MRDLREEVAHSETSRRRIPGANEEGARDRRRFERDRYRYGLSNVNA